MAQVKTTYIIVHFLYSTGHKIQISGLPQRFDREKFESLLSKFGSFQISETREETNFVTATVQYGSKEDVERFA